MAWVCYPSSVGIKYIVSCLERNTKALISEDLAMDFSIFILVQQKIEGDSWCNPTKVGRVP